MAKERRMKKTTLAERIGCTPGNIQFLLSKGNMDTKRIIGFSKALGFNFFTCYSSMASYNKRMENISRTNAIKDKKKSLS